MADLREHLVAGYGDNSAVDDIEYYRLTRGFLTHIIHAQATVNPFASLHFIRCAECLQDNLLPFIGKGMIDRVANPFGCIEGCLIIIGQPKVAAVYAFGCIWIRRRA